MHTHLSLYFFHGKKLTQNPLCNLSMEQIEIESMEQIDTESMEQIDTESMEQIDVELSLYSLSII